MRALSAGIAIALCAQATPASSQGIWMDNVTIDNRRGAETDVYLITKVRRQDSQQHVSGILIEMRTVFDGQVYVCPFGGSHDLAEETLKTVPVVEGVVLDRIELQREDGTVLAIGYCRAP